MGHTPGPWTVGPADWLISQKYGTGWRLFPIRGPSIAGDGGYDIATVYCDEDDSEQDANIRLISASPDMLAALHLASNA